MSEDNVRNFGEEKNNVLKLVQPSDKPTATENRELIRILQDRLNRLKKPHRFKVGDLVVWKEGFQDSTFPRRDRPSIVVDVLDEPRREWDVSPSSSGYGALYDVQLLIELVSPRDGTVRYETFWYDSQFFTYYKEEAGDES